MANAANILRTEEIESITKSEAFIFQPGLELLAKDNNIIVIDIPIASKIGIRLFISNTIYIVLYIGYLVLDLAVDFTLKDGAKGL